MRYNKNVEKNVAERLRTALNAAEWDLLQRIAAAAEELRLQLFVVGGVPRDLLLGRPISDFDLVVEGRAATLAKLLKQKYGGRVTVHGAFGTAKWDVRGTGFQDEELGNGNGSIDFVTARSEIYRHPAALPTVRPGTIVDDLRRRDFTINALAIRLDAPYTGEVRDDFGGWEDIKAQLVRVLHDTSFIDDPTRMYRAVRYEQRYGFAMADDTLALIPPALPIVGKLSAQRIRHELDLVLAEPRAAPMLGRLATLGLLAAIHRALAFDEEAGRRVQAAMPGQSLSLPEWPLYELRWVCWLLILPGTEIEALNKRLHFEAPLYKAVLAASNLWRELELLAGASPSRWTERLDAAPLMAVYAVYLSLRPGPARSALEAYLTHWRHVKPNTTGHDLRRMGLEPGAEYKRILGELRRAWLDGEIRSGQEEQTRLERILARTVGKRGD